jgi:hypothetical protein
LRNRAGLEIELLLARHEEAAEQVNVGVADILIRDALKWLCERDSGCAKQRESCTRHASEHSHFFPSVLVGSHDPKVTRSRPGCCQIRLMEGIRANPDVAVSGLRPQLARVHAFSALDDDRN